MVWALAFHFVQGENHKMKSSTFIKASSLLCLLKFVSQSLEASSSFSKNQRNPNYKVFVSLLEKHFLQCIDNQSENQLIDYQLVSVYYQGC